MHVAFLAGGAVAVALPAPAQGWAVPAAVAAYVVALPLVAARAGRADWVALWAFLLPVSVLQVLPDWVLADLVGTLRFPDVGGPRVDDVIPVAMAGVWVAPLFAAVALSGGRPGRAALLAVGIFLGSELLAPAIDLWEPTGDTTRALGVALYVLPAEAALDAAAAIGFAAVGARNRGTRRRGAGRLDVLPRRPRARALPDRRRRVPPRSDAAGRGQGWSSRHRAALVSASGAPSS